MKPSLLFILITAACFRLYNIHSVPPSPSLDEVSIGYNAYSILKTGGDEYGNRFPLLLRAYDDWRPAIYVYLVIPFVSMLGLHPVAVRLPAVILGVLTVYAVYKIGLILQERYVKYPFIAIMSSLLLAISPWHIYLSRLGHEVNLGITLFVLGVYNFFSFVTFHKKHTFIISSIFFALSLHGYQSEKVVTPLFILCAVFFYLKDLLLQKKTLLIAIFCFMVISLPAVLATFSPQGMTRLKGTSAFSIDADYVKASRDLYVQARNTHDLVGIVSHNRYMTGAKIFLSNYVSHFRPRWLFWGGDREAHKVPGMGLLYSFELPFIVVGLATLFYRKNFHKIYLMLVSWIIISPIPAAITTQAPHAMRSFTMAPVLCIVEALGLGYLFWVVSKKSRIYLGTSLVLLVLGGLSVFWKGYFYRFATEQSDSFQYAASQAMRYAYRQKDFYRSIEFAHYGNLYQSYMFYLFTTTYDPSRYLSQGGTLSGGYDEPHSIDKFKFGNIPSDAGELERNTLYFWDISRVPTSANVIAVFQNLDGKDAIKAGTL